MLETVQTSENLIESFLHGLLVKLREKPQFEFSEHINNKLITDLRIMLNSHENLKQNPQVLRETLQNLIQLYYHFGLI